MRLISRLRSLLECRRGNALVIVAATTPLLIGASAVGLDTIQVTLAKRDLQRAADSAAMAGAYAVAQGHAAGTAVDRDLALNNRVVLASPRVVENAPTTGPETGNARAVRIVLDANRYVPFFSFFRGSTMAIQVEATAAAMPDGVYCVRSLEPTAQTGITFAGSATVNLGCGVHTNSSGGSAAVVNGNPNITVDPVAAVGGLPPASAFTGNPTMLPYSIPQPDPYASLPDPTVPNPCYPGTDPGTATIGPGCYQGLNLARQVTLLPGTYIIDGGALDFRAQADVTGTGVTFVLTSSNAASDPSSIAQLQMNGGAEINLTAPTSGEYAGLLFYQDRRAPLRNPNINGNSGAVIEGALYFPSASLTFNGNTDWDVRCLRIVARQVTFSGNVAMTNTCPAGSPNLGYAGLAIRLVN